MPPGGLFLFLLALNAAAQEAIGPASTATTTAGAPASTQSLITVPIAPTSFTPFSVSSQVPLSTVYPLTDPRSPPSVGSSVIPDFSEAWSAAYAEAKNKLSNFTIDEKVSLATGVGWMGGRCVGNTPAIGENGTKFPGLCLEDSPLGVRYADYVTSFPAGINAAATFNRKLIRRRGLFLGRENVGKGVNVALGPMMNIGRVAEGGRNWEGFGADPYLAGEAAYETILGMQEGGVQACAKHLINNEQEHFRTQESSDVDDRTQHEIYAHPFMRSIMAGVASIMCSYNLINGTYACENDKIMNDIIKREYGFQGYIMSDWGATHSTISAATGLDMTMPGDITFLSGTSYFGANLTAYVQNNTIEEARLDDMATRILAGWYFLHQDAADFPTTNFDAFFPLDDATNEHVDVQEEHFKLVREMAEEHFASGGAMRGRGVLGRISSLIRAARTVSWRWVGVRGQRISRTSSRHVTPLPSGRILMPHLQPLEAIQQRARKDRTSVSWILDDFNTDRAGNMAIGRSAALVFISSDSGEDYITVDGNEGDRNNLTAWHNGDNLVLAVAAQNNNTIVIAHSVGPLILEPWIEHPNVTAVLWAGIAGQEAGNSITDVLYGEWNPSGRLPYTIAQNVSDYPTAVVTNGDGSAIVSIPYTEGLNIDYRHFDAFNITPRFEFGFGLSYTNFTYSDLNVVKVGGQGSTDEALEKAWAAGNATPIATGSSTATWLHRPLYNVTFDVENSGPVWGGDIPQLYLHFPPLAGEPPSLLKGFTNVEVLPGDKATVALTLSRYDLSFWDAEAQGWRRPNGTIGLSVGTSSRDFRLSGSITVD
ncbi:Glycoside hydrolase family 3 protein [Mycena chlorophos]|uniref:beta-glucosidase n=1 Tax=Mycena chlorophos TaxID=658473 RepID=A0A8H6W5D6_MYCCL|nr:Glycoside hydrolase family 3 protein [Mycena chlorophos]